MRVPHADQGRNRIPDSVTDEQALFVGDILATGYWAARISEIKPADTVLIIGAGPTGLCTQACILLKKPEKDNVCETDARRNAFVRKHYPQALVFDPRSEDPESFVRSHTRHRGADVVLEVAGTEKTFEITW